MLRINYAPNTRCLYLPLLAHSDIPTYTIVVRLKSIESKDRTVEVIMRKVLLVSTLLLSSLIAMACSGARSKAPVVPPLVVNPGTQSPTTPVTPAPEPVNPAPEPVTPPPPPKPEPRTMPKNVRGIHLSGWYAGSPDLLNPLLEWCTSAGINTLVLEIKAEDGKITWMSDFPMAAEIGANARKVGDINKLMAELREKGFWVIGRIVVMNDQYLYRARPDWVIPGFDGGAYSFMDPKNEGVWKYNIDLAKEAVKVGFDEIQFDYIRYPDRKVQGYNLDNGPEARVAPILGFLKQAAQELKPLGVMISADVFGLTTSVAEGDDMGIGQDYLEIAKIVDYISAMAYPSHYAGYTYGIPVPNDAPYDTVFNSLGKALERTPGIPIEKHRPWIQDFSYLPVSPLHYGPVEVMAQVQALRDLGINSFMLWDPSNKYSRGVDFKQ